MSWPTFIWLTFQLHTALFFSFAGCDFSSIEKSSSSVFFINLYCDRNVNFYRDSHSISIVLLPLLLLSLPSPTDAKNSTTQIILSVSLSLTIPSHIPSIYFSMEEAILNGLQFFQNWTQARQDEEFEYILDVRDNGWDDAKRLEDYLDFCNLAKDPNLPPQFLFSPSISRYILPMLPFIDCPMISPISGFYPLFLPLFLILFFFFLRLGRNLV